jgi:serine/threonine-protein kinase
MLTGHVPFAGLDPLETLRAHRETAPPALPARVPAPARDLVERSLQKRPEARFASAASMGDALAAARRALGPAESPGAAGAVGPLGATA